MLEVPPILSPSMLPPEFEAEIEGLQSIIELAKGSGSFSIAVCNSVPVRQRIIERLRASFPAVSHVTLPPGATNPFGETEKVLGAASGNGESQVEPPDALMVDGFNLLDPAFGPRALSALNLSRELWQRRWPCAVVFWITRAEIGALVLGAPDLWAWKSHLFEFSPPGGRSVAQWTSPRALLHDVYANLSKEERIARRDELRRRLAEPVTVGSVSEQSRRSVWSSELAALSYALGDYPTAQTDYEYAAELADAASVQRTANFHLRTGAFIAKEMGDLPKAHALVHKAFLPLERILPSDHPDLVASYLGTALDLRDLGDLTGGRAELERAIERWERQFGADHPELAHLHKALGLFLRDLGDLPGAQAQMERALVIQEKHSGPDQSERAKFYSALAMILRDRDDFPAARATMERAIAIDKNHLGPDHPGLASEHYALAGILDRLGDQPEAQVNWERAIAIWQKHSVRDPYLTSAYCNSALVLQKLGDLPGARARMEEAITIEESRKSPNFSELAICHHNLAWILAEEGDFPGAVEEEKRATLIGQQYSDKKHDYTRPWSDPLALFQKCATVPPEEAQRACAKALGKAVSVSSEANSPAARAD